MPSINFTITAEDKNLQKILKDIEKGVTGTAQKVEDAGMSIEDVFTKIKNAAAGLGVAIGAKELVSEIVNIRGEFQQLEIAFNTMLGSEERANALMQQIVETSAKTPFGLQDLANGAKQLMAYGVAAENVNDNLIMLGDIAAGLSIPLGDLVYLYGTTMTQGRMFTQDLRQFQGRGIPLADELAKQFGVTKDKVAELVTAGKVGFDDMHKALLALTSDGGKFAGLMNAQSQSISGRIETLKDSIEIMFNEIGKASEGVINTTLDNAWLLVENYEKVGKILTGLVSTYGVYKAALLTAIAIEKVQSAVIAETALQMKLAAMAGHQLTAAQARGAAMATLYSAAQAKVAGVLKSIGTKIINPYTLAAVAITGIVAGIYKLATASRENEVGMGRLNTQLETLKKTQAEFKTEVEGYVATIQSETATEFEKAQAYDLLIQKLPKLKDKYTQAQIAAKGMAAVTKEQNQELENQSILLAKQQIRESQNRIKVLNAEKEAFRRNGNKAGYNSRVAEIKEEEKALAYAEKMLADFRKTKQKEREKSKIQNKKYWTDIKTEAQMALDELGSDKKGTDEWIALEKKIKQAEAELEKYSITKGSKDVKDKYSIEAEQAERKEKIQEYKDAIIEARTEAEFEIAQAEINAMKDGLDKTMAQIDLDYDKQIEENRRRKEDMVEQLAEQKSLEWEMANPKLAEQGKKFDKSTITEADLTPEMLAIIKFYDELAKKERELAKTNATKELLSNYQTYMQKRIEAYSKYEKDLASMKNEDGTYKKGFSEWNEAILHKKREETLAAIDVEFAMQEEQFAVWANEIANMSLEQLDDLLLKAEEELDKAREKVVSGEISKEELAKYLAAEKVIKDARKGLKLSPEKKAEKDWKELYETLGQISSSFDEIGQQVGGVAGEIISLAGSVATGVISMIDGVKTLSAAAVAQMSALEKASVILAIVSSAMQVVTKIADAFAADYTAYNKAKDAYQSYMSVLNDVIARQKELIETMTGDAAIKSSEEALRLINKQIDATKKLGKERLNAGASAGSHSIGRRILNSIEDDWWGTILRITGPEFGNLLTDSRLESLFDMPVEKLKKLKEEVPQFWAVLDKDVREYLENIISYTDEIEEVAESLKEAMTQVSFDSLYDSFLDTLMDMEVSTEDFADNLSEILTRAMLSDVIGSKYKEKLKKWYESFASSMEEGLSEQEIAELRREYEEIVNNAIEERNKIAEVTGYGSSATSEQSATYGGFETMSEDTGSELNGRFTALQMAGEEIKTQMITVVSSLQSLVVTSGERNSLITDILTQTAIVNAHLADLVKYSKVMSGYGAKLDKIVEQTKNL